jgi:hypothetical protein
MTYRLINFRIYDPSSTKILLLLPLLPLLTKLSGLWPFRIN